MTPAEQAYTNSVTGSSSSDELVMQELSQVYYIAARIRERLPQHVDLEDLVSAGVVGLIEASRSFNEARNAQFKTFAKFRIRGAILDSLREVDWGSRLMRRRGREIADATTRLEARLGRKPADAEIAAEMNIDIDYLRKIVAQLDTLHITGQCVVASEDGADTIDLIEAAPDLHGPNPFDLCLEGEMRAHLAEAISNLSEREQLILSLYYREELTMKEIAKVVGVALSRVSQIREAAVTKLRKTMAHVQDQSRQDQPRQDQPRQGQPRQGQPRQDQSRQDPPRQDRPQQPRFAAPSFYAGHA
ncbi:MAG TPA: FliA/WhiG family RNA polymerase sigma factor [Terracidiphilus sp.]|jgi:RNA polymerase sigma factor for flagellar operon FliA|nr:FliA/WhiG family RNA polymerase sigma factor [Terracidiphilus sp.]